MRFVSFAILLSGCVSPGTAFDQYAKEMSINKSVVTGGRFEHAVYEKSASVSNAETLHVYIGSDGTPWRGNRPASDPTPRNPLALRLMLIDPAPAIYIGRPCYHGLAQDPDCNESVWTSARYSADTVDSMAAVIAGYSAEHIILIGYSGGGSIAALLASRLEKVRSLLTIAANLDTAAWVRLMAMSHWATL